MDEVGGNHFVIGVFEDALEVGFGSLLEGRLDLGKRGFLDGLHGEVHGGNGGSWHAEGHAGELAFHFRANEGDSLRGTGGGWDDVDRGAAATFPILLGRAVHGLLRGGVGVNGGHEALGNAESFLEQHVHDRCQAVGGAARVGDDVVFRGIVVLIVHAHHKSAVLTLGRRGNDDLLGTGGDVALGFFGIGEEAGGFDHDFHAEVFPGKSVRSARAHDLDFVAVDDDDVVFREIRRGFLRGNRAGEAALGGVVFEEVSEVVRGNDVTNGADVEGGSEVALLDESTEDKAADAAESVDGDSSHISIWGMPTRLFRPAGADCAWRARPVNTLPRKRRKCAVFSNRSPGSVRLGGGRDLEKSRRATAVCAYAAAEKWL